MQGLVAAHPELIADDEGPLLLIRREQPITDREDGAGRWSLDHLFVTRTGVPVLVELKRAVDTRLRREVVGQMLDYAANGTAYWQAGRIAESFAASAADEGRDADAVLAEFLGTGGDPEAFWQQVDANFSAGRIRMVFVADTIPRELARIVEFLNEQMKADVRAVELSWFESGDGVTALAPRIIGETERAQSGKAARRGLPAIGREEWIRLNLLPLGPAVAEAAGTYVALVAEAGGHAEVTLAQASLVGVFDLAGDTLYPVTFSRNGKGTVQLCLNYIASRPAFSDEAIRRALYDRLVEAVGPLSSTSLKGFPGFPATRLNDPAVKERFLDFLKDLRGVAEGRI